jgi:hypothetical protein
VHNWTLIENLYYFLKQTRDKKAFEVIKLDMEMKQITKLGRLEYGNIKDMRNDNGILAAYFSNEKKTEFIRRRIPLK